MYENIVSSIICSQFDSLRNTVEESEGALSPKFAMQVKFSYGPDYDIEDGYRNLTILLTGFDGRYIAVFAKADWNVVCNKNVIYNNEGDEEYTNRHYTKGESPWVCYGYHDSCWRDAVENILREYHGRISTIDSLFNGTTGWYKKVMLTDEQIAELKTIRDARYKWHVEWTKLSDVEFKFEGATNGNR